MAKLYAACYGEIDRLEGVTIELPVWGSYLGTVVVDFSSGAAKGGAAIPAGTKFIKLLADAACHAKLQLQSANPEADTSDEPFAADAETWRRLSATAGDGSYGISAVART